MAVDFGELVDRNAQEMFGLPIVVTPVKSAPMMPPYGARGIWSRSYLQIMLEEGAVLSTATLKVSIYERDPQFAATGVPVQGDEIMLVMPSGVTVDMIIDDTQSDGQGGVDLILKFLVYPETHA